MSRGHRPGRPILIGRAMEHDASRVVESEWHAQLVSKHGSNCVLPVIGYVKEHDPRPAGAEQLATKRAAIDGQLVDTVNLRIRDRVAEPALGLPGAMEEAP